MEVDVSSAPGELLFYGVIMCIAGWRFVAFCPLVYPIFKSWTWFRGYNPVLRAIALPVRLFCYVLCCSKIVLSCVVLWWSILENGSGSTEPPPSVKFYRVVFWWFLSNSDLVVSLAALSRSMLRGYRALRPAAILLCSTLIFVVFSCFDLYSAGVARGQMNELHWIVLRSSIVLLVLFSVLLMWTTAHHSTHGHDSIY